MVGAPQRRQAVQFLQERTLSQRRGCALVSIGRSSVRYEVQPRDDEDLASRLREFAVEYKRYGYRQAWAQFRGKGIRVNHKRVYRIWRKEGLALPRRRRPRPRSKTSSSVPVKAEYPNHVWTYDFMQDATADSRKLRLLTLIDEFTRENLAIEMDRNYCLKVDADRDFDGVRDAVQALLRSLKDEAKAEANNAYQRFRQKLDPILSSLPSDMRTEADQICQQIESYLAKDA